jgi:hypothetical protein
MRNTALVPNLWYYAGICLDRLRTITKDNSPHIKTWAQDLLHTKQDY